MTFVGALWALVMLITGHKPFKFYRCICFRVGKHNGCNMGLFIFAGGECKEELLIHEHGHAIQNCLYGPFMPFVVGLPSSVRFNYRRFCRRVLKKKLITPYEGIWFEAEATALGKDYIKRLQQKETAV